MRNAGKKCGFTLLELAIVVALIAIIVAVTLPELMPAIAYGELEGSARHLANYGRAAMARATMNRERITVEIDVTSGEYWALRWVKPEPEEGEDGGLGYDNYGRPQRNTLFKSSPEGLFGDKNSAGGGLFDRSRADEYMQMAPGLEGVFGDLTDETEDQALRMKERFDDFVKMQLMARAANVKHEGILDEIGPLFEKDFSLDGNAGQEQEEEILEDTLLRSYLPRGVYISSVRIGNEPRSRGVAEIEITPLGLMEPVTFEIKNEDGDSYTVVWDAITAGARLERGDGGGS